MFPKIRLYVNIFHSFLFPSFCHFKKGDRSTFIYFSSVRSFFLSEFPSNCIQFKPFCSNILFTILHVYPGIQIYPFIFKLLASTNALLSTFWQQQAVLRKTFTLPTHPPPTPPAPPKMCNILLYYILKIACHLYCVLKKALKKSRPKKVGKKLAKRQQIRRQKRQQKGIKKASKKAAQKAARKAAKKFIPEPVLLLSWNRSKTGLVQLVFCVNM